MKLRDLLALMALIALVVPATGSAWRSNRWQNPTGNISCRYDDLNLFIRCMTWNDGLTVQLRANRSPARRLANWSDADEFTGREPVLAYGVMWRTTNFKVNGFWFRCV